VAAAATVATTAQQVASFFLVIKETSRKDTVAPPNTPYSAQEPSLSSCILLRCKQHACQMTIWLFSAELSRLQEVVIAPCWCTAAASRAPGVHQARVQTNVLTGSLSHRP
jgi:hypothetical protein